MRARNVIIILEEVLMFVGNSIVVKKWFPEIKLQPLFRTFNSPRLKTFQFTYVTCKRIVENPIIIYLSF